METEYMIEGMTCGHCVMHVKKALLALSGVRDAAVELDPGKARVQHDGTVKLETVRKAVEGAGYRVVGA